MEDVRPFATEESDELDEAGEVPRTDRAPNVLQRDETNAVCRRGLADRPGPVRRNRDVEFTDECREQLDDVGLSPADLGERDQQQDPRPPRPGS